MPEPRICGVIVDNDPVAIKEAAGMVDLFELRIDLAGKGWEKTATGLKKPWIATNRSSACGGKWRGSEDARIIEPLRALDLGATIVDIELETPNLAKLVPQIRRKAKCMVSFHDWKRTPTLARLSSVVRRQIAAGADICKVVTTTVKFSDNLTVLELPGKFRDMHLVSFAMGEAGRVSRVLSPLAGGYFTYASLKAGRGSAPGQVTVKELSDIYRMVGR